MIQREGTPVTGFFETMEHVPSQVYFGLAMGSIIGSALAYFSGRRDLALFIGEWAPTFLVLPLFYKLLRPAREEMRVGMP